MDTLEKYYKKINWSIFYLITFAVFLFASVILLYTQTAHIADFLFFKHLLKRYLMKGALVLLLIIWACTLKKHTKLNIGLFVFFTAFFVINHLLRLHAFPLSYYIVFMFLINAPIVADEDVAKTDLFTKLGLLVVIFFVYFTHLFPASTYKGLYRMGTPRFALGFTHPNVFAAFVLTMICSYLLLRNGKAKWYEYLIMLAVFAGVGYITQDRGMIVAGICLIIGIVLAISKGWRKIALIISPFLIPIIAVGSMMLSYFYNPKSSFMFALNAKLSQRLRMQHTILRKLYKPTLFGQSTPMIGRRHNLWMDNMYVHMWVKGGWIGLLLLLILLVVAAVWAYKTNNYWLTLVLVILVIQEVAEAQFEKSFMLAPFIFAFAHSNVDRPLFGGKFKEKHLSKTD